MILFNKPPKTGDELNLLADVVASNNLCGDGIYSKKCEKWIEETFGALKSLLTPSCTAALELAAILIGIEEGDEVIMPSYTFVSTANAFVLRKAKIVFVDIRKDTMNIDESLIEAAITPKTKAIVPVHYAGVPCEMDTIMDIATRYNLWVIEDAAQAVMSKYKGKALGTIGDIGCFSFHETKNYTSGGEGGAILINTGELIERAKVVREKGTNRSQFINGLVDKYTWQDIGSSFLPSELQAAYLLSQLECAKKINEKRLHLWHKYYQSLSKVLHENQLPCVLKDIKHNAHMFFIKLENEKQRNDFISFMKNNEIITPFHYIPLHTSPAGKRFGIFNGEDRNTSDESSKLVRLPLYYNMEKNDIDNVITKAKLFFKTRL